MHRSIYLLMAASFLLFLTSCQSNPDKSESIVENKAPYTIRLAAAEEAKKEVPLSDFAKSIEYVRLESNEESLIGRGPHFYVAGDQIISSAFRQIQLFNKSDGSFIKEISSYGDGPDQYRNTLPWSHFNEKSGVVYVRDNRRALVGLSPSGEQKVKFQFPSGDSTLITGFYPLEPNLYVGFHSNYDCAQNLRLILFNSEGELVKSYKNHSKCINEHPDRFSFDSTEGSFYGWNNHAFFKETFNDTLFHVSKDSLSFRAVFENEGLSLPYEKKTSIITEEEREPYFSIWVLDETDDFIFFNLGYKGSTYSAYYNKKRDETKVAYRDGLDNHNFTNDLDEFLPFNPSYATDDGRLVGYLEAPYVLEWFELNPEKAAKLPPALKQFENMREDDNPIVMIVNTKN